MTSLWFERLRAGDRVSVKPHASPVLHAINYLIGELDETYLTSLREFGGLQSYPEPRQGSGPGRLLDRFGGNRRHRADLGRDEPPLRRLEIRRRGGTDRGGPVLRRRSRAAVFVGRRRGTRRRRRLGGDPRPRGVRVRRDRLDRRHESPVARPSGAPHRRRQAGADVRGRGLAGHHGEVRSAARIAVRPVRAVPHCEPASWTCRTPEYQRLLRCDAAELRTRLPGEACGAGAGRPDRRTRRRHAAGGDPQSRRPRLRHPARGLRSRSTTPVPR